MNMHEIAREWVSARNKRKQAKELSNNKLAAKFECSAWAIARALNCRSCPLSEEDQILVRQCAAERDRLRREVEGITMAGLCRRYKIGRENLITALMEIGEWEVAV